MQPVQPVTERERRVRSSYQGPRWPGEEPEIHSKGCGKPQDGFKVGGGVAWIFRKLPPAAYVESSRKEDQHRRGGP